MLCEVLILLVSATHVDILLIQMFRNASETGYYKAAMVVSGFVTFAPVAIQVAFVHLTSELWDKGNTEDITRLTSRATKYNLLLAGLVTIGIASLSQEFVPFYFGSDYTPAIPAILVLLPGTLALAIARPIIATGQGSGRLRILVRFLAVASLINLIGNVLLIPKMGIIGAAIATSVGYGSILFFAIIGARKIGFDPLHGLSFIRLTGTLAISSITIYSFASIIESNILSLILVPVVGGVIFLGISLAFKSVKISELRQFMNQS